MESDPIDCNTKQIVHECYQVPAAKEIHSFTRNPIRRNFEPPKGVSVDRTNTNIESDAQKMVDPNIGRACRKLLLLRYKAFSKKRMNLKKFLEKK